MTEEQIALARRAVACKGWRWMPGMRTMHNPEYRVSGVPQTWVLPVSDGGLIDVGQHYQRRGQFPSALGQCVPGGGLGTRLPDLADPATLGCLLALVREAHAVPFLQVSVKISREHGYQFDCYPHHRGQWVDSEAEALVAALEDAP